VATAFDLLEVIDIIQNKKPEELLLPERHIVTSL
jgi:hypothetical protein